MRIVSGTEMREIDHCTIHDMGFDEFALMESAGRAFTEALMERLSKDDEILVLAGGGNNGGDAIIAARHLLERGYRVRLFTVLEKTQMKGAARRHLDMFERMGHSFGSLGQASDVDVYEGIRSSGVIVDGLLGTGVRGAVREPYKGLIEAVNEAKAVTVALDIPSGMPSNEADSGSGGVIADLTITLACPKETFYLPAFRDFCGTIVTVDIGIPKAAVNNVGRECSLIDPDNVRRTLPVRQPGMHKGDAGRGILIAGSRSMPGAAALAAEAAIRSGAGLFTLATGESVLERLPEAVREAMYLPMEEADGQVTLNGEVPCAGFDGIAAGPGLGRAGSESVRSFFRGVSCPLILDADALYRAKSELDGLLSDARGPVILTPHPGEMAAIMGVSVQDVEQHRFSISRRLAEKGCYVVLKGRHTIITAPDGAQWVNTSGTPALAKGGTGDVLTGMILAFVMQISEVTDALKAAVYLHGAAGEMAEAGQDTLSVTAGDVIGKIGPVIHACRTQPGPIQLDTDWKSVIIK